MEKETSTTQHPYFQGNQLDKVGTVSLATLGNVMEEIERTRRCVMGLLLIIGVVGWFILLLCTSCIVHEIHQARDAVSTIPLGEAEAKLDMHSGQIYDLQLQVRDVSKVCYEHTHQCTECPPSWELPTIVTPPEELPAPTPAAQPPAGLPTKAPVKPCQLPCAMEAAPHRLGQDCYWWAIEIRVNNAQQRQLMKVCKEWGLTWDSYVVPCWMTWHVHLGWLYLESTLWKSTGPDYDI
jgi:hypothetical protein